MSGGSIRIGAVSHALSAWQPAVLRPWEEGVYQRAAPAGPYACWTGRTWLRDARTPEQAARQTAPSDRPAGQWRGLAAPSGSFCSTCRGHSIVDRGVDPATGDDLLAECPDCA